MIGIFRRGIMPAITFWITDEEKEILDQMVTFFEQDSRSALIKMSLSIAFHKMKKCSLTPEEK